jgi:hypothetical protein
VRVDLTGLHRTYKRLASGKLKIYYYAWRNGPRLKGEPGTPEFLASYNAAVASKVPVAGDKAFTDLIRDYLKGGHFNKVLSPRTQNDYFDHLAPSGRLYVGHYVGGVQARRPVRRHHHQPLRPRRQALRR